MKKLLFVYDNMNTGGTTTALLSLLKEIDYEAYSVDLLLFDCTGPFLADIPKEVSLLPPAYRPIFSRRIPMRYQKMFFFALNGGLFRSLASFFRHRNTPKGIFRNIMMHQAVAAQVTLSRKLPSQYDAAIAFIEGWSDHYVLSTKVKAAKKIAWIHPDYAASYLLPEADKKVLPRANNIVLVSDACRSSFLTQFPALEKKAVTIENILSPEFIRTRAQESEVTIPEAKIHLCTVCRCDMQVKGLDRMISVLHRLKKNRLLQGVVWHLIGDGKDFAKISEAIQERQLQDHVHLWGHANNPFPVLRKMDAFVLASRYEGKPMAVSEALCLGIPCIVTNYVSACEQIQSGLNGIVTANSEDGLYNALESVLTGRVSLAALKAGAQNCAPENTAELLKLYAILR